MLGKECLILEDENTAGTKAKVKFLPTVLRHYKLLVGFSGTVDSALMNILSPYISNPKFVKIPNMKIEPTSSFDRSKPIMDQAIK
jgi:hypothetical protein